MIRAGQLVQALLEAEPSKAELLSLIPDVEYWDLFITDVDDQFDDEDRYGAYMIFVSVPVQTGTEIGLELTNWRDPIFQRVVKAAVDAGYVNDEEATYIIAVIRVAEEEVPPGSLGTHREP